MEQVEQCTSNFWMKFKDEGSGKYVVGRCVGPLEESSRTVARARAILEMISSMSGTSAIAGHSTDVIARTGDAGRLDLRGQARVLARDFKESVRAAHAVAAARSGKRQLERLCHQ